ncbi:MerR family transcriptional regulator [Paraburkholderia fungorum]|jgi:DNA-binding transcriptional MerR regulator|uniref:DNA-binding transcriptional MerR regulator n=1 Tax=Paraburkholderia fungorum TaxID=134537 RepID=A0AAJ4CD27_9BURK|nr:MerR family transcriptional regulator [Paraburkholderia fungorum]MBB4513210.1 DNA-binding transcriptional MerR regulator [Paraburkholderia fungorum]MBB5540936.1 DNA-binding transcriptional MerR regulator [Paraburkholderia fungorum]MBB6201363.1 DNA-binding transcriptional MerR regulator [Paraburkholderia fungorum]MBU7442516.1 MerR family transcriptional regulator [Paraburkholderia fungorum]MDT8838714.1 MerR family transcriptional regulator [Paraburkholderia fungorum]
MKIGKLAELSGLSASRIRFYEASGVIKAVERTANGYRDYPSEALTILEIIAIAQRAGFSLEQIRHLLPTDQGSWQHESLVEALKQKVTEIEAMQERLNQNRAQLLIAIESIENRPANLDCSDRKEWVLGRLRENGVVPERKKGSR